jgi:cyclic pyranopterin phosphate synthase
MTKRLTHVDSAGKATMVDVSAKPETERVARAIGTIRMESVTLSAIRDATIRKGDVLGAARIAGIMAAKRTAELIPLCHPINLDDVQVDLEPDLAIPGIRASAMVKTVGRTGVEMEALTAVSVALLTIYDMVKAIDRGMQILDISLVEKSGGRSGHWIKG